MAKRIKLPGWILILAVIFLFAGGINKLVNASIKEKAREEIQEQKLISNYPKINLKTVTKQSDKYTYSINIPETDSEKINKLIDEWINGQKRKFLQAVEQESQLDGKRPHLHIQMETYRMTDNFYSLVFHTFAENEHSKEQHAVKIFNIDLKHDRSLAITDILNLKKKNREGIQKTIWEELKRDQKAWPHVTDKEFIRWAERPEDWEWSIHQKHFSMYMNPDAMPVNVPVEKIYALLKEDIDLFPKLPREQKPEKDKMLQQEQTKLDPNGKYIALTFDDGPSPEVTPKVLKTLKDHDAKATFFMLGNQVDFYPGLARKVAEEGHEIGNHSRSHPDFSKIGPNKVKEELNYTKQKIKEATGTEVHLIRPPYGSYGDCLKEYAEENGDAIILWSVDSVDWRIRNAASILKNIQYKATPGGIVLMHDIHPSTADALPKLLTALEDEGYQFVTVSQLLQWEREKGAGPYYGSIQ